MSEKTLQIDGHLELEVEYQGKSIEKYGLDIKGDKLLLTSKQTDCLALDHCGIPESLWKPKVKLSEMTPKGVCSPNSGCC